MRARSLRVDNRATTSVTSNLVERKGGDSWCVSAFCSPCFVVNEDGTKSL